MRFEWYFEAGRFLAWLLLSSMEVIFWGLIWCCVLFFLFILINGVQLVLIGVYIGGWFQTKDHELCAQVWGSKEFTGTRQNFGGRCEDGRKIANRVLKKYFRKNTITETNVNVNIIWLFGVESNYEWKIELSAILSNLKCNHRYLPFE